MMMKRLIKEEEEEPLTFFFYLCRIFKKMILHFFIFIVCFCRNKKLKNYVKILECVV